MANKSSVLIAIQNGFMTINEARELSGIASPCHTHSFSASAPAYVAGWPSEIKPKCTKTICEYCSRPNKAENDLCASCGAPLPI